MNIDIGIPEEARKEIAHGLSRVLADSYTLYLKTHNFHWNVTGPMFHTLHTMFETQYTELATAVDDIAERIRALGHYAPGSYREFAELASVKDPEQNAGGYSATKMIEDLVVGHETTAKTARTLFNVMDEANDEATADLMTQRIQVHEKTAWMLRSLLDS